MRLIVCSLAVGASLTLAGASANAQDATQAPTQVAPTEVTPQLPTQVAPKLPVQRPSITAPFDNRLRLRPGTFIRTGPGQEPLICIHPKITKSKPVLEQRKRNLRKLTELLRDVRKKASAPLRLQLKNAIELLEKLKDPCGPGMQTLMMGKSAMCQGGSGD